MKPEQRRENAVEALRKDFGIDFNIYKEMYNYKFSPEALVNALKRGQYRTMENVKKYYERATVDQGSA